MLLLLYSFLIRFTCSAGRPTAFPGGHSEHVPPDPIPNSEVKLLSADDSVGSPHVKVGHCQGLILKILDYFGIRGFFLSSYCPY